jgi:hypothetical protein
MSNSLRAFAASALLVASMTGCIGAASAAPAFDRLAINNASPTTIESVQWRGWGWGAPVAGGIVAGALLGSALAAPYYYGQDAGSRSMPPMQARATSIICDGV